MINLRSSEHTDMYFIFLHKELLEICYNKNQDSKGKTKILKVKMEKNGNKLFTVEQIHKTKKHEKEWKY